MKNRIRKLMTGVLIFLTVLSFVYVPVFAEDDISPTNKTETSEPMDEETIKSTIDEQGTEKSAGNLFIWFLCALGFLKVSQNIDEILKALGINLGRTGGNLLSELLIVGRGAEFAGSIAGKAGMSFKGGNGPAGGKSPTGVYSDTHGFMGAASRFAAGAAAGSMNNNQGIKYGVARGAYESSKAAGGSFSQEVISSIATGSNSNMTITGDEAASAMTSYMQDSTGSGIPTSPVSYSNVEMGGGRITGTEHHEDGGTVNFAMYNTNKYVQPQKSFTEVKTADGQSWYKQYAQNTVEKTAQKDSFGNIRYTNSIVQKMPEAPQRKDRI